MSEFGSESPLDKDCRDLKEKFGYDYIELQLDFSMVSSTKLQLEMTDCLRISTHSTRHW